MTFYLKPSEGTISTNLFHAYAICRLKYLASLRQALGPVDAAASLNAASTKVNPTNRKDTTTSFLVHSDCLVQGSAKDRVSHFALRSAAILDSQLNSFIIQKEQLLFLHRLERMTEEEMKLSIMMILKQLKDYRKFFNIKDAKHFEETEKVLMKMLKNKHLEHITVWETQSKSRSFLYCPSHQSELILAVPFTHVLPLVIKRDIQLQNGKALLRCDQIPVYLTLLFKNLLDFNTKMIKSTACFEKLKGDARILWLLELLQKIFSSAVPLHNMPMTIDSSGLSISTLDTISHHFPPCMKALHRTLRLRHRLCHRPRVQYTLFLKEIGLPVEDCLRLLETEYSRPTVDTDQNRKHVCEHSWNKDSRRYIYGTRHLYGLEGCKKNYSSHSCHTIQREAPGPNECGGCPFVHYDQESLKTFLTNDLNGKEEADLYASQQRTERLSPIESCHLHLRFKLKKLAMDKIGNTEVTQELRVLENSQVKIHAVFKPKHYFSVLSKVS